MLRFVPIHVLPAKSRSHPLERFIDGGAHRRGRVDHVELEARFALDIVRTLGFIHEIRDLIRSLAGDHTVLLSSHILPEVAMTCSRAVVVHRGRVAADVPVDAAAAGGGLEEIFLRVTAADVTLGVEAAGEQAAS